MKKICSAAQEFCVPPDDTGSTYFSYVEVRPGRLLLGVILYWAEEEDLLSIVVLFAGVLFVVCVASALFVSKFAYCCWRSAVEYPSS